MISQVDILSNGIPLSDSSVDCIITDPPYDLDQKQKAFVHSEFLRVCRGDILVFSPPENQWVFDDLSRYLFWVKPTSTKNISRNYSRFVEMIFLYKRSQVWNTDLFWANYTGVYHDVVTGKQLHPFEKPLSLIERFVQIHTNSDDTILDPFCGSGTTLLAAKRYGRDYIGYDNSEQYIESSKERLNG